MHVFDERRAGWPRPLRVKRAAPMSEPIPNPGGPRPWSAQIGCRRNPRACMSDVLVLCYHAVSDVGEPVSASPRTGIEARSAGLLERGYVGATVQRGGPAPPAARTLAVTFDDAYRSVYDEARPVLRPARRPGTVFVPTALIGSERPMAWPGTDHWLGGPTSDELTPMSWDELGELAGSVGDRLPHPDPSTPADARTGSRCGTARGLARPTSRSESAAPAHRSRTLTATTTSKSSRRRAKPASRPPARSRAGSASPTRCSGLGSASTTRTGRPVPGQGVTGRPEFADDTCWRARFLLRRRGERGAAHAGGTDRHGDKGGQPRGQRLPASAASSRSSPSSSSPGWSRRRSSASTRRGRSSSASACCSPARGCSPP